MDEPARACSSDQAPGQGPRGTTEGLSFKICQTCLDKHWATCASRAVRSVWSVLWFYTLYSSGAGAYQNWNPCMESCQSHVTWIKPAVFTLLKMVQGRKWTYMSYRGTELSDPHFLFLLQRFLSRLQEQHLLGPKMAWRACVGFSFFHLTPILPRLDLVLCGFSHGEWAHFHGADVSECLSYNNWNVDLSGRL